MSCQWICNAMVSQWNWTWDNISFNQLNFTTPDFKATFINYTNVSGMWTMLSFTATTNKNGTIVQCWDISVVGLPSNCTLLISGMN